MTIGETARKALFWGLDYLSGSPIRNHLQNIQQVSANASLLAEHQAQQLKSLLTHAVQTTDYYKNCDPLGRLEDFPVVNKNIIRESFERFESTAFKGKKLKVRETSGSTGTPFRVVHNSNKCQRLSAELICSNSIVGYRVGVRHVFFRAVAAGHSKSAVKLFMQNEIEFDIRIQDLVSFERQRQILLQDRNIEFIIGYPSALYDLARYIISQGDTPKSLGVKGVLCVAEPLYPAMRDTIRKAFDCPVLSRYANLECGVLADECPTCNRFHLNSASYFFEILDWDRDEPTSPGTPGRIVITDLYNYALPMIRYDTGDIGSVIPNACPQFATPILQSLEGRRYDSIYDPAGLRIAPFVIHGTFNKLSMSVKQFQFIQEGKTDYSLRLCVNENFSQEQSVVDRLKQILGADARIKIDYVAEIPVLNSGKRQSIVNLSERSKEDLPLSN